MPNSVRPAWDGINGNVCLMWVESLTTKRRWEQERLIELKQDLRKAYRCSNIYLGFLSQLNLFLDGELPRRPT